MWHELVLNGIGGRTIQEAKERISHDEFVAWCAYVRKTGTLNTGIRVERGLAMLANVTNRTMGGTSKLEDFLPNREQEPVASVNDVFALIKSKVKGVKDGK